MARPGLAIKYKMELAYYSYSRAKQQEKHSGKTVGIQHTRKQGTNHFVNC